MGNRQDGRGPGPDPLWYKDAVIYQLHVKAFKDSNDDGVGDFRGLTEKLDYIADLGVDTVWLLPFYPSPMRDDGYDVADYRNIHQGYGTRADFRRFVRQAHRRGIRVITELVVNHTSDQHPWFQASRRAPRGSAKRNYYVWSDTDQAYAGTRVIFTDTESSNWAWDPVAQQYYWHRFFSHQPDLNFANPSVVKAVIRVMRFWLDMGVDGLRLDAIPYLCEREGTSNENLPETHQVLKQMRAVVDAHYQDRLLLAEANQWPEDVLEYFGDGDECHMAYHFPLMPRMYMALAQEERHPIVEILEQTPAIPEACQWALFLRNHDELTLEMVTDEERDYLYQAYARDPRARVNVGIRRRLAPLLENDPERLKLLNSLLLSMPGSPILYYGDEIGMGDNVYLGDRNGVRTPMQWSPERNAGFSRADPQQLYLPPIMDPVYGYEAVNVEAQSRDVYSLLNWTRRMIAVRRSSRVFGRGTLTFLAPGNRRILAYLRELDGEAVLCVANLAHTAQPVELDLARFRGRIPVDMMGRTPFPPVGELPYLLTLPRHGFFWFRLTEQADVPDWHVEVLPRSDLVTLVLSDGWTVFFPERLSRPRRAVAASALARFTGRALPDYLRTRRGWPAGFGPAPVALQRRFLWETPSDTYLLLEARAGEPGAGAQRYLLPLAVIWGSDRHEQVRELLPAAVARVRAHARVGLLYEAFREGGFCRELLVLMRAAGRVALAGAELVGESSAAGREVLDAVQERATVTAQPDEWVDGLVHLDGRVSLKLFRRALPAPAPQVEVARFLTERAGFPHVCRFLGAVTLLDGSDRTVLAVAEEARPHQGDAWQYVTGYLERFLDEARLRPRAQTWKTLDQVHQVSEALLAVLGRRLGELHVALVSAADEPGFAPTLADPDTVAGWWQRVRERLALTLTELERALARLPVQSGAWSRQLLERRGRLEQMLATVPDLAGAPLLGRIHGDLQLGRVLLAEADFLFRDFGGDRARAGADLQRPRSPLEDVASLGGSLEHAVEASLARAAELGVGRADVVREFAVEWLERAQRAVLSGYRDATEGAGLYRHWRDAERLTALFGLDWQLAMLRRGLAGPESVELPLGALLRHAEVGLP